MSHLIERFDNVVLAGKPAWHGLGIVVEHAPTPDAALQLAALDWKVQELPLIAHGAGALDGLTVPVETHKALRRSDTGEVLAVVGADYEVLQNAELAATVAGCADEDVRIESAGSLRNGRDVWFLARLGGFKVAGLDEVEQYALFANNHSAERRLIVQQTDIRVVCHNTLSLAIGKRNGQHSIRHTRSLPDRLASARHAVMAAKKDAEESRTAAAALAGRKLSADERNAFFLEAYEAMSQAKVPVSRKGLSDRDEAARRKAVATIGDWLANLEDRRQQSAIRDTAWAALNSVTQWVDHERTVRVTDNVANHRDARQFSNLLGTGAEAKQRVLARALALVG